MTEHNMKHLDHITHVVASDVAFINWKDRAYGGSWKRSGGRSAWFMCVRMMDRLRVLLREVPWPESFSIDNLKEVAEQNEDKDGSYALTPELAQWLCEKLVEQDVFAAIEQNPSGADGTVLAVVRDLRRYLILIEAEMVARGVVQTEKVPVLGVSGVGKVPSLPWQKSDRELQYFDEEYMMLPNGPTVYRHRDRRMQYEEAAWLRGRAPE